jgi:hypothetical protein
VNQARVLLILSILTTLPPVVEAKAKHTPSPASSPTLNRDYVAALSTANQFLHAWQAEDHEAGLLLLSDTAKRQVSETRLNAFFSPDTPPQRAFQISRGKKLRAGRYTFPVSLLENSGKATHTRNSQIVVANTAAGDWVVDKLP